MRHSYPFAQWHVTFTVVVVVAAASGVVFEINKKILLPRKYGISRNLSNINHKKQFVTGWNFVTLIVYWKIPNFHWKNIATSFMIRKIPYILWYDLNMRGKRDSLRMCVMCVCVVCVCGVCVWHAVCSYEIELFLLKSEWKK